MADLLLGLVLGAALAFLVVARQRKNQALKDAVAKEKDVTK